MKNVAWKLFNFQGIFCKMGSEEVYVLIWRNFDNFANTYVMCLILCKHKRAWN